MADHLTAPAPLASPSFLTVLTSVTVPHSLHIAFAARLAPTATQKGRAMRNTLRENDVMASLLSNRDTRKE